jgi:DNA-binding response OmpR family regulator
MQNILLAEDDKMQAKLIHQRLTKEGATVKEAGNGREAMQFLRSQEFSMAILDVKMPVMDGFEVLERIRGELKLEIPVIMVTAMGSENDIIRGYELGATDYILKPFSEVQLVARVKSLLK